LKDCRKGEKLRANVMHLWEKKENDIETAGGVDRRTDIQESDKVEDPATPPPPFPPLKLSDKDGGVGEFVLYKVPQVRKSISREDSRGCQSMVAATRYMTEQ
jgi:hypothetical protein